MRLNICLFFDQCTILVFQYVLISVKAIIGYNIRQGVAGEFPYVVSIMKINPESAQSGGEHFCTGVLITRFDVLTSDHCLFIVNLDYVQIVIGSINIESARLSYPYWWMTYEHWAIPLNLTIGDDIDDIANIRLLIQAPTDLSPVRISSLSNNALYGKEVTIAGWGINNNEVIPDIMNYARMTIVDNSECEGKLENVVGESIPINREMFFCSFVTPYTLLASGDSGGPLLYQNKLIGINKGVCPGSMEFRYEDQVNLHIRIRHYRHFIEFMKNC